MTVYIEYVLIDNFVIDFFLLSTAFMITGKKDGNVKRVIAAVSGAVFALTFPLVSDLGALTILLKIASGLAVVFAAAKYDSVKDYYVNAVVFFALTFAVGGAVIGVFSLFDLNYSSETAIAFAVVPVYLIIRAARGVIKYFFTRSAEECNTYDCEITLGKNAVKLKGFMDTGNSLYDGDSPVVICGKKTALKIMGQSFPKIKYIALKTATGESKILSFKSDELKIFISGKPNIFKNITVAAAKNIGSGYDVILHPALKEIRNERNIAS